MSILSNKEVDQLERCLKDWIDFSDDDSDFQRKLITKFMKLIQEVKASRQYHKSVEAILPDLNLQERFLRAQMKEQEYGTGENVWLTFWPPSEIMSMQREIEELREKVGRLKYKDNKCDKCGGAFFCSNCFGRIIARFM